MSNLKQDSFYKYLISKGYYFDKNLIENFLLSLKVKPFEILTGNSGTGKTKLSQLFAKFIFHSKNNDKKDNYFTVKAKTNYASWKNMGWTLPKKEFKKIFPIEKCEINFDMLVDGIPAEGKIDISLQLFYTNEELKQYFHELYEKNPQGTIDLNIDCLDIKKILSNYEPTNGNINLILKANKSAARNRQWMAGSDFYKYIPFNQGFTNCNVFINNISYDAKVRVMPRISYKPNHELQSYLERNHGKELEIELKIDSIDFDSFEPESICYKQSTDIQVNTDEHLRYQIVPVGSNWTDNTNIVGYYNVITEEYQSTPAYELIKQAQRDSENPYFLILDEMNLSHVERYFADFLSAIESNEEIPLYGNNKTLKLPNNLFIIGTVNVDETTYMFSPKVLDRANTIEFNTLFAWDYMMLDNIENDFKGNISYLQSPLLDSDIAKLNMHDLKEILSNISFNNKNLWDTLARELTLFQEALKDSSFDFGFRVINEILRFMVVAWRYENSPDELDNWERYFDAQIKQKILPKLHGSEKVIGNVLKDLFNLCLINRENNETPKNFNVNDTNSRYINSALKLQSMTKVLLDQRYVSFIN